MKAEYRFTYWFTHYWSRTALPMSVILLLLSPLLYKGIGFVPFLVFLQLPIYMLHQYEEHSQNKFKEFVNHILGRGKEILGDQAIFWINILLVWILDLCVLYIAYYVNPALGLIASYLTVFNGLLHIVMAIILRRYNPGLWTSIVLFLPIGGYSIYAITRETNASLAYQLIGLVVAILGHAVIILYIRRNIARSRASSIAV